MLSRGVGVLCPRRGPGRSRPSRRGLRSPRQCPGRPIVGPTRLTTGGRPPPRPGRAPWRRSRPRRRTRQGPARVDRRRRTLGLDKGSTPRRYQATRGSSRAAGRRAADAAIGGRSSARRSNGPSGPNARSPGAACPTRRRATAVEYRQGQRWRRVSGGRIVMGVGEQPRHRGIELGASASISVSRTNGSSPNAATSSSTGSGHRPRALPPSGDGVPPRASRSPGRAR